MIEKLKHFAGRLFSEKKKVVRLQPNGASQGCVVVSYITWPFVEGVDSPKMRGHTNAWEVTVMAQAFLDLGFRVEVCHYHDEKYIPPKDCKVVVDIHGNLERWPLPPMIRSMRYGDRPEARCMGGS